MLDIPEGRIKVIPMECGGAFGAQDPRPRRATGRPALARRPPTGLAHHDPPRGAHGRHASAERDHPPEDGREAGRHPARARSRDDRRIRCLLGRVADDERRLPGQRLPVADLRRARLRGAHPQDERRRLSRAAGAADALRDRLPDGPHRPSAGARSGRVQAALPAAWRRPDGQRPGMGGQWRGRVPARAGRPPAVARARGVARQRRTRWPRAARHRPGGRRLGAQHPADQRHRSAGAGWHAGRGHRLGRHRRHQHGAGADRGRGIWGGRRAGARHHRRYGHVAR